MRSLGKLVVKSPGLQRQQKSCSKNQIHIYLASDSTFKRQEYQKFKVTLKLFTEFEARGTWGPVLKKGRVRRVK